MPATARTLQDPAITLQNPTAAAQPSPSTIDQMERHFASDPAFIDRAAHLLLVALPKDRSPTP